MEVFTMPLGPLQANCYLLTQGRQCVAIDPGDEAGEVLAFLRQRELTLCGILLTHGHFDHAGACHTLVQATHCPVYLNEQDLHLPPYLSSPQLCATEPLEEGDRVVLGRMTFTVLATPGHSQGSVCLQCGENLFTGDTLFAGSCGRTDFPGGSWQQMRTSLSRLSALRISGAVYPGHGPATTLDMERAMNPYMR